MVQPNAGVERIPSANVEVSTVSTAIERPRLVFIWNCIRDSEYICPQNARSISMNC